MSDKSTGKIQYEILRLDKKCLDILKTIRKLAVNGERLSVSYVGSVCENTATANEELSDALRSEMVALCYAVLDFNLKDDWYDDAGGFGYLAITLPKNEIFLNHNEWTGRTTMDERFFLRQDVRSL